MQSTQTLAFTAVSRQMRLRLLFIVCGLTLGWMSADVVYGFFSSSLRLRLLTTYVMPLFAGVILICLCRFGGLGKSAVAWWQMAVGLVFLATAAVLDLVVTVRSDPYLTLEANPYIRVLLDETTHSYAFVFAHVAITQILFVAIFGACWWAFLRHRELILEGVIDPAPTSWLEFLKAATGGKRLTYRQWLLPLRPQEIPDPYYSVWPVALAASFGTSLFRYWAASEWLLLVPAGTTLRIAVLATGVGGVVFTYYAWLGWKWRKSVRSG